MRLLLDAHTVLWAVDNPEKLSTPAHAVLQSSASELSISAATIWEIGIKTGLRKLQLSRPLDVWIKQVMADLQLKLLPITRQHVVCQAELPFHHRDPFDRLLVAQARIENMTLVSADTILDQYGAQRLW